MLVAHALRDRRDRRARSERPLSLGGAGDVPASVLAGFDYVALGHIHRPQRAGGERVRYAGSLLKYSFSEHDQHKSVTVVDVGAPAPQRARGASQSSRSSSPRCTTCVASRARSPRSSSADARIRGATTTCSPACIDRGALLDPLSRLREVYPWTMKVERPEAEREAAGRGARPDPRRIGEAELFADFFRYVTGDDPSEAERAAFVDVVDRLRRVEPETAP